ncbi:ribosomal protein S18-alanine N-acetyltransferase [Caldimonas brevitalea]|uniref:[Ribosomal protein bS18]-alanine N-acetyltransferase n=1 Tax=Caldimonas brevitalea TaxID=413882 RepID=A0A0G3BI03_9BURK|nr:ribosomal protein S18-alanine N-acetyltransferase [Caldimonas brevitalea]AKJ27613.1 ribosomal-protein-alanine N-acetyltransferase [Caldimonas brevitalea]
MTVASLREVLPVEQAAYEFPWTRGNFIDSLHAGYDAQLLMRDDGTLIGYFVAMAGVDEMHLLNLTVTPSFQRQGHALRLLDALCDLARSERGAHQLWLEVRVSNLRARAVYDRYGFRSVGLRRGYYPAAAGRREDAIVMSLGL